MKSSMKSKVIVLFFLMAGLLSTGLYSKEGHGHHWGYEGATGPDHWGEFFETCKVGQSQSPIDIKGPFAGTDKPIKVDYKSSVLRVLDNGHTIQVNYDPGSMMTIDGKSFELLQFHFHKPSEEKISGKNKAMVVHLVHKSKDGKLAVIGVLIDEGTENPVIKTIWSNLPRKHNEENVQSKISINASDILPAKREYYHFMGSLTTPPCTEGVAFYIMKNTIQVSSEQVKAFPYKMNARPTQPLNGRQVFESK